MTQLIGSQERHVQRAWELWEETGYICLWEEEAVSGKSFTKEVTFKLSLEGGEWFHQVSLTWRCSPAFSMASLTLPLPWLHPHGNWSIFMKQLRLYLLCSSSLMASQWNLNSFDSLQDPTWCSFCLPFFSLRSSPNSHIPHHYISVTMIFFMFMYEFFLGLTIIPKWIFRPSKCILLKEDPTPWNKVKECFPASCLRDFAFSVSSTWTPLTLISVKLCHSLH